MFKINSKILYYYINIFIVLSFMIISFVLIKPNSDRINLYKNYNSNNNILEINEVGKSKINLLSNNSHESSILKINNNGDSKANYDLKYRIYDTNIDKDKITILVNSKQYNYYDIVSNDNGEYTDLFIDSDNIDVNSSKDIEIAFIVDSNDKDIYINGSYVINSIDSLIVFK